MSAEGLRKGWGAVVWEMCPKMNVWKVLGYKNCEFGGVDNAHIIIIIITTIAG